MIFKFGYFMLLASSWLTAWRFYCWARKAERRLAEIETDHGPADRIVGWEEVENG